MVDVTTERQLYQELSNYYAALARNDRVRAQIHRKAAVEIRRYLGVRGDEIALHCRLIEVARHDSTDRNKKK